MGLQNVHRDTNQAGELKQQVDIELERETAIVREHELMPEMRSQGKARGRDEERQLVSKLISSVNRVGRQEIVRFL